MPDPDAARVMRAIDKLSEPMRDLANEFGAQVVLAMIADGHSSAKKLRTELETWRDKRQAEWLATDYKIKVSAFDQPKPKPRPAPKLSQELLLTELFPDL